MNASLAPNNSWHSFKASYAMARATTRTPLLPMPPTAVTPFPSSLQCYKRLVSSLSTHPSVRPLLAHFHQLLQLVGLTQQQLVVLHNRARVTFHSARVALHQALVRLDTLVLNLPKL